MPTLMVVLFTSGDLTWLELVVQHIVLRALLSLTAGLGGVLVHSKVVVIPHLLLVCCRYPT